MKNTVKTFTLFVRDDRESKMIAETIRQLNACSKEPLKEDENGDLIIAIGGDGTFLNAVTKTGFSKTKVYAGVHTGTLGFLQDIAKSEIYTLIKYFSYEAEINTRRIMVPNIIVFFEDDSTEQFKAFNEVLIAGKDYTKIKFQELINGEFFQEISGNGIIVSSSTGDTAYSLNAGGAIDFSNHAQLICTPITPIKNNEYPDFVINPVICSKIRIALEKTKNLQIITDGRPREISPKQVCGIEVSILNCESYINKVELQKHSKVEAVRKKLLGYDI